MEVHRSALKHGIAPEGALYAAEHYLYVANLDEENPARDLRLGFDSAGRLLELVVLHFDSGNELLIYAMKARPEYVDLILGLALRGAGRVGCAKLERCGRPASSGLTVWGSVAPGAAPYAG